MRIYLFIEHYPNPYKPYIDAQIVQLIKLGHEVSIFAGGAYMSTIHPDVHVYGLLEKTAYCPTNLSSLPSHLGKMSSIFDNPALAIRRIRIAGGMRRGGKETMLMATRALCLPRTAPDLCLIHNLATAARFAFLSRCYPNCRVAMYFHGGEVGGVRRVSRERDVFAAMHVVFTNTDYSRSLAISRGCLADAIVVIPVGFDFSVYPKLPKKLFRPDGRLRLISVGRLGREKGLEHAIAGLKLLVDSGDETISYRIVGSGQEACNLKALVERMGLDKVVTFAGEKDNRGVVNELAGADVLILPSITTENGAETQACVVQEAMLMGLPVITTRAGGVPESIPRVMDRFAVEPGSAKAISDAIRVIQSHSIEELNRIRQIGREFVSGTVRHRSRNRSAPPSGDCPPCFYRRMIDRGLLREIEESDPSAWPACHPDSSLLRKRVWSPLILRDPKCGQFCLDFHCSRVTFLQRF